MCFRLRPLGWLAEYRPGRYTRLRVASIGPLLPQRTYSQAAANPPGRGRLIGLCHGLNHALSHLYDVADAVQRPPSTVPSALDEPAPVRPSGDLCPGARQPEGGERLGCGRAQTSQSAIGDLLLNRGWDGYERVNV